MATVLALAMVAAACSNRENGNNVRPPKPGTPAARADVQGIYRTIHQSVLQLRGNGGLVMVVPEGPGPSAGSFTLDNGAFTVTTDDCGDVVGQYRLVVTGEQAPDKARLEFTSVRDDCADRRHYLTIDPWIYAVSRGG